MEGEQPKVTPMPNQRTRRSHRRGNDQYESPHQHSRSDDDPHGLVKKVGFAATGATPILGALYVLFGQVAGNSEADQRRHSEIQLQIGALTEQVARYDRTSEGGVRENSRRIEQAIAESSKLHRQESETLHRVQARIESLAQSIERNERELDMLRSQIAYYGFPGYGQQRVPTKPNGSE